MIAVIVINFGSPKLTIRFVNEECVKIQEEHVVIVVDNASTDDTFSKLKLALPDAVVLRCAENQGFARANNQGADYAIREYHPEFLLFTNNDIAFRDFNVVDVLITEMRKHPQVGIIGPQVIGLDGKRQSPNADKTFAQRFLWPTWGKLLYKQETLNRKTYRDYKINAQEGSCGWASGCFFVVSTESFDQVGGFDPATFLYGEEQILTARFSRIGKSVYFCPRVTVIHEQGATSKKYYASLKIRLMEFKSVAYYYRHYVGTPSWEIFLGRVTLWLNVIRGK